MSSYVGAGKGAAKDTGGVWLPRGGQGQGAGATPETDRTGGLPAPRPGERLPLQGGAGGRRSVTLQVQTPTGPADRGGWARTLQRAGSLATRFPPQQG